MARRRASGEAENRLALGRQREEARFPVAPATAGLPQDYADTLGAIKQRIQEERLRVVLAANSAMVLLYWDIGRMILARQDRAGWGAAAWAGRPIVPRAVAQLPLRRPEGGARACVT